MAKKSSSPASKSGAKSNPAGKTAVPENPADAPVPLKPRNPNDFIVRVLVLFFFATITFLPAFDAGWIWDDDQLITRNPAIQRGNGFFDSESWKGLGEFWFPKDTLVSSDYFPLTSTTFWVEWRLWGNNEPGTPPIQQGIGSWGYHITNVLLHALCAVLLWLVLQRMKVPGAWAAALIWAVHPVCVESVAWVSERKNTLSMIFYLLTILSWLKYRDFGDRKFYRKSLIYFLCALLAKTSVVPLPMILLLIVWWKNQKITLPDFKEVVPYFVAAFILGLVTVYFQYGRAVGDEYIPIGGIMRQKAEAAEKEGHKLEAVAYSYTGRVAGASMALGFYVWKALVPVEIRLHQPEVDPREVTSFRIFNPDWPREHVDGLFDFLVSPPQNALGPRADLILIYPQWHETLPLWAQLLPGLIIAALFGLAWVKRKEWGRHFLLGAGSFVLTLLPVLGILKMSYMRLTLVADHFQYLSLPGLVALVVAWVIYLFQKFRVSPTAQKTVFILVAGSFAYASFFYSEIFQGMNRLWTDTLIKNRNTWQANNHMGALLFRDGKVEQALYHFLRGVELKPYNCEVHNNAGLAYSQLGNIDKALYHFREAVRIKSDDPSIRSNYANALLTAQRPEEAAQNYLEAIEIMKKLMGNRVPIERNRNALPLLVNLSAAYLQCGKYMEASDACKLALQIDPNSPEAKRNLDLAEARIRMTRSFQAPKNPVSTGT